MVEWTQKLPGRNLSEKLVWIVFCAACFQLVFRIPYIKLVPGDNTNLFSGVLCAVTLLVCVAVMGRGIRYSRTEIAVCLALTFLTVLNAVFSSDPFRSSLRGFTFLASGLGGFWCSRILLRDEAGRGFFTRLCLVFLVGFIITGLAGYYLNEYTGSIVDLHKHPYNGMIFLLSFAPLTFLWSRRKWRSTGAISLLVACYSLIALSFDPMIWFPPILVFTILLLVPFRRKALLIVTALLVVAFAGYFHYRHVPPRFGKLDDISTYIRVENLFFSLYLAEHHPWLGIGLCAPREPQLEGYDVKYPYITKELFRSHLPENRTSENQFLTFLSDMGLPFSILYGAVLALLTVRLIVQMRRGESFGEIPSVSLFVPIAGELLHFQFYDGLLHPQICWFFHLLLAIIPSSAKDTAGSSPQIENP